MKTKTAKIMSGPVSLFRGTEYIKKIFLLKGDNGAFYHKTVWLDKKSLITTTSYTQFTEHSLYYLCGLYLSYFLGGTMYINQQQIDRITKQWEIKL